MEFTKIRGLVLSLGAHMEASVEQPRMRMFSQQKCVYRPDRYARRPRGGSNGRRTVIFFRRAFVPGAGPGMLRCYSWSRNDLLAEPARAGGGLRWALGRRGTDGVRARVVIKVGEVDKPTSGASHDVEGAALGQGHAVQVPRCTLDMYLLSPDAGVHAWSHENSKQAM